MLLLLLLLILLLVGVVAAAVVTDAAVAKCWQKFVHHHPRLCDQYLSQAYEK